MRKYDAMKGGARQKVFNLVRSGHLPRADSLPCTDCGHLWTPGCPRSEIHEYDHYLGYEREHWADVQAVCQPCHIKRDRVRDKKTHCCNGHKYTPENTGRLSDGIRYCRQCVARRNRAYKDARRLREPGWQRKPGYRGKGTKPACRHGHKFTEANTYVAPNGSRVCLTCRAERKAKKGETHA